MVARPPGQPLEQLVPPDPWVVTDHQLGAIDNMDPGSLATGIREQERRYWWEIRWQVCSNPHPRLQLVKGG